MIHLVKLCVGVETPTLLAVAQKKDEEIFHLTRGFPKRADEILSGGSLYWIFGGFIRARQLIIGLERVEERIAGDKEVKKCKIVFDRQLVLTENFPRRAFQGWRYLEEVSAPPDLDINLDEPNIL